MRVGCAVGTDAALPQAGGARGHFAHYAGADAHYGVTDCVPSGGAHSVTTAGSYRSVLAHFVHLRGSALLVPRRGVGLRACFVRFSRAHLGAHRFHSRRVGALLSPTPYYQLCATA